MAGALRRFYALTALVLLVGALVLLTLLQPVIGTRTDFSVYNTRWNGASDVASDLYRAGGLIPAFRVSFDAEVVEVAHRSFAEFDLDPPSSALVVIGPDQNVTPQESRWLATFVAEGGLVVVADDFGRGNDILRAAGSTMRFEPSPLRDLAFTKNPDFVVVNVFNPDPLTAGVEEAVLDFPGALDPGPLATVLASSAPSSWLDRNRNDLLDNGEEPGPFPWMASETIGRGRVVAMSDPSVLINGMRPLADNGRLLLNLETLLEARTGGTLIDESHRSYPDPVHLYGAQIKELDAFSKALLGVAGFLVFLLFTTQRPGRWLTRPRAVLRRVGRRFSAAAPSPEKMDLAATVLARHPAWDENTLRALLVERGIRRDD